MEFDKRITDISKIMNCFTTEEAKKYLHTSGYFADHIEDFWNLDTIDMRELTDIQQEFKYPYSASSCNDSFKFFLPCAFVADEKEEKEKKLRPYKTIGEFPRGIIGSVLTYRSKSAPSVHILTSLQSIALKDGKLIYVYMDGLRFTPSDLLTDYEYLNATSDEWLPFGVEECY